ncbi:MAG: M50 family metallopeptidase [Anaerolineaceae bacterium]|nr:M50 family metallopeptidase [Anaerolineaceae bacterium]
MSSLWVILQFVLVLGILIILHELGHAIASTAVGIHVEEFGLGLPPRLKKLFTFKGTEVTLNAIPFGGFVRPKGQDDASIADGMAAAAPWKRLIILLAGVAMNFIVGLLVFIIMYAAAGKPIENKILVYLTTPNTPGSTYLKANDQIVSINGKTLANIGEMQELIKANAGTEIEIGLIRNGQSKTVRLTPRVNPPENEGAIGFAPMNPNGPIRFAEAVQSGWQEFTGLFKQIFGFFGRIFKGNIDPSTDRAVGIKGMYDMFSYFNRMDKTVPASANIQAPIYRLAFVGMLSTSFGLINILPVPPMDGGQILLLLPELLFKKKFPQKIANTINSVMMLLMLMLMAYLLMMDFVNPIKLP